MEVPSCSLPPALVDVAYTMFSNTNALLFQRAHHDHYHRTPSPSSSFRYAVVTIIVYNSDFVFRGEYDEVYWHKVLLYAVISNKIRIHNKQ